MSKLARFVNGIAIDVLDTTTLPEWAATENDFLVQLYPDTSGSFRSVPDNCVAGWYLNESDQARKPAASPARYVTSTKSAYAVYTDMTVDERVALREAAKTDPVVEDLLDSLKQAIIVQDTFEMVDGYYMNDSLALLVPAMVLTEERLVVVRGR
tara:strand:+ start:91 stop:552 length:462 start_codon:yes stop_codon:yes gene_type:complete